MAVEDYIVLVNAEMKGTIDLLLTANPERLAMHWDQGCNRSRLCVGQSSCRFCPLGRYFAHYAAGLVWIADADPAAQEAPKPRPALVQLPLGFVCRFHKALGRGRWIKVVNWHVEGKRSYWTLGKQDPRELPEAFPVLDVVARITGVADPDEDAQASPRTLPFRRRA